MSHNKLPVGTTRIRTRHKRGGEQRAWVKIAEPNSWVLRSRLAWESENGPIPAGMCVHHKDRDKLNDTPGNLELVTVGEHLAEHRAEFIDRAVAGLVIARRARRWSTRSATKRTGRPLAYPEVKLWDAVAEYLSGTDTFRAVAARHGVSWVTLSKKVRLLGGR